MKRFCLSRASALLILSTLTAGAATAGVDDYPTSIAGCHDTSNPSGASFTGDLKDAVQDSLIDPWALYNRECTSFCGWRLQSRNGFIIAKAYGNADAWGTHAKNDGYAVNMTPAIGAIAWWSSNHVAWVEAISADGSTVTVEDYNDGYPKNPGFYKEHTISVDSVSGYIHFKDITGSDTDIWVNGSVGNGGNGSQGSPYNTVIAALNRANATQPVTIHITPGIYSEKISTSKRVLFVTNGSGTVRIGG